jgi:pyridoxamine 5'-phosphate oxidase
MNRNLPEMRKNYTRNILDEATIDRDPFAQFALWFDEACAENVMEANAMVLATVDQHGVPMARTVLLKGFDERGLRFFSNYDSRKGRDIDGNPAVAVVFNWLTMERQVRITGTATQIDPEESDAYFASPSR